MEKQQRRGGPRHSPLLASARTRRRPHPRFARPCGNPPAVAVSTEEGVVRRLWAAVAASSMAVVGAVVVVGLNSTAEAAVGGTGTGYLSTRGNQIIDAGGNPVRMTGIN